MKQNLTLTINGDEVSVAVESEAMLLDLLRDTLYMTGTKKGCGKGECGACTVILNGKAVNACMIPVMKAQGARVETVEGLAKGGELSALQSAFVNQGAIQCGFCTPGMLMSAKALLDENPLPSAAQVREAIGGNVCRCTGYKKIEQAILSAAASMREAQTK